MTDATPDPEAGGPELDADDLADQYPPGPSDQGRTGGMATRENAPELTEAGGNPPASEPTA